MLAVEYRITVREWKKERTEMSSSGGRNELRFSIITPSASKGHGLETMTLPQLLEDWVVGIDFKGLGEVIAVEDVVVRSREEFMVEVERIAKEADEGKMARLSGVVEIMRIPQMAGG